MRLSPVTLVVPLLAILLVVRTLYQANRKGKSSDYLVQPKHKGQQIGWGLRRMWVRQEPFLKGILPVVGNIKVGDALFWMLGILVGVAPIAYNFLARREQMRADQAVFWGTVAWLGLYFVFNFFSRARKGKAVARSGERLAESANAIGGQVEALTRLIYAGQLGGAPEAQPREVLSHLLRATGDTVRGLAGAPPTTTFCSALLVMSETKPDVLETILYMPPECRVPSFGEVGLSEPGAGKAVRTKEVVVIEDTKDPAWNGHFTSPRYSSFGAFPIIVGGRRRGRCLGCVTVESSRPYTITQQLAVRLLQDALRPQLECIGLTLMYAEAAGVTLR
jgi:hypothetical protein